MSNEQVVEGVKRARGDWALASEGGLILEGKKITGGDKTLHAILSTYLSIVASSSSVSNITMLRLRALRIWSARL